MWPGAEGAGERAENPLEEAETGAEARKMCEPVVHSGEWTTSSLGSVRNRVKSLENVLASGPLAA